MGTDHGTHSTVRALWEVGDAAGRPPAPVPEVDPWADEVAGEPCGAGTTVVFDGVPEIVVRLHRDGLDAVQVDQVVDLDVPRRDVVAVVERLLSGRARRTARARGFWSNLLAIGLGSPAPTDLVVRVGSGEDTRTYVAAVAFSRPPSGWVQSLPLD